MKVKGYKDIILQKPSNLSVLAFEELMNAVIDKTMLRNSAILQIVNERELIPCKLCGRYDDQVEHIHTPTGVCLGELHPWCASEIVHSAMKELVQRMS